MRPFFIGELGDDSLQETNMKSLLGLEEYLQKYYRLSIFEKAFKSKTIWSLHMYNRHIYNALIVENDRFEFRAFIGENHRKTIPKLKVKIIHPIESTEHILPLINYDPNVKGLDLEPIIHTSERNHIKNKSLYVLMRNKVRVHFTLLEGEVLSGTIAAFSRYGITLEVGGNNQLTIMRHAVFDMRDKNGRCYLKTVQEETRDWEKSNLFLELTEGAEA
jgi:sRNA-binding regulator protein Hfq